MTQSMPAKITQILDTMPLCPASESGFGLHEMKAVETGIPTIQEWMCAKCPTTIECSELSSGGTWIRMVDAQRVVTTASHGPQPIAIVAHTITEGVHVG